MTTDIASDLRERIDAERRTAAGEYRELLTRRANPEPGDTKRLLELAQSLGRLAEIDADARTVDELNRLAEIDAALPAATAESSATRAAVRAAEAEYRIAKSEFDAAWRTKLAAVHKPAGAATARHSILIAERGRLSVAEHRWNRIVSGVE